MNYINVNIQNVDLMNQIPTFDFVSPRQGSQ